MELGPDTALEPTATDGAVRAVCSVLVRARVPSAVHDALVIAQGLAQLEPTRRMRAAQARLGDEELARKVVEAFARAS